MLKQPRLADVLFHAASPEPDEISTADEYEALTPSIIEPQESSTYIDALNFACSRGDIRNIAVTGAYGAGKSSVLRTWKECPDNDLRIMTVSLADFEMQSAPRPKAEPAEKDGAPSPADDKKAAAEEKTIEYSILQQLLYKEKKSALPYSRIERISDISTLQVAAVALDLLVILSVMLAGLLCVFPNYVRNKLSLPETISHFLIGMPTVRLVLAGVLIFTALFLCVKKLHRIGLFDRRVSVDKIDMLKGAISTRPSSPSLLNVYIDEIVYFFDKTGYNVVIFEDLDRHNDGAIFIKLREINQIINNTRPDTEPVRFIYAVRDGLFSTAEARTKFFDFVIPVIPVMDSENAAEHFSSMFRENELSDTGFSQCVSQLALFIPDMRVMRNISNEFRIYQNLVNGAGDITRLLSMIAYKNVFAEDYHAIDEKKGVLYSFVKAFVSGDLQKEAVKAKRKEMDLIQEEIDSFLKDEPESLAEIRRGILSEYLTVKQENKISFYFSTGERFNLETLSQNEVLFQKIKSLNAFYLWSQETGSVVLTLNQNVINEIMERYEDRKKSLDKKMQGYVSQLKMKIDSLENDINGINLASLAIMARFMGSEGFLKWEAENCSQVVLEPEKNKKRTDHLEFIYFLLIRHYIATDYMFYRSVFRPGSLSHEDNEFIKSVSIGRLLTETQDMPLNRIENVTNKLYSLGLMMEHRAWHPDVLLYLLEQDPLKLLPIVKAQAGDEWCLIELTEHVFIKWGIPKRIRYVELIVSDKEKAFTFIQRLAEMNNKTVASELLILQLCSSQLEWNYETTEMKQWAQSVLASNTTFPDQVPQEYLSTFIRNVTETRLHPSRLDVCETAEGREIVRSLVDNRQWEYSAANLKNIFIMLTDGAETAKEYFHTLPLSAIESIGVPALKEVVWNNINNFILDLFIHSQDYSCIPELLNNNSVSPERCFDIVTKMQFTIEDVCGITNRPLMLEETESKQEGNSLYSLLLANHRLNTNWSQIGYLLKREDVSDVALSTWFNENSGAFEDNYLTSTSKELIELLIQKVFNSPVLNDVSRKKILSNLHLMFLSLPENLNLERVALLVEYGRLAPTTAVFRQINDTFINEGEKLTEMLVKFVLQFPALLRTHPWLVLKIDKEFDRPLAEKLFSNEGLSEADLTDALNWLWSDDPDVFSGSLFIEADSLGRLAPGLSNDDLRRQLLVRCLEDRRLSDEDIIVILTSFKDDDYQFFISDKSHRSLKHNDPFWQLATLLEGAGFIRSLSWNEELDRIWFIPHNSPVFRRN
ncbi:pcar (plasmid) [Pantoea allii]|uniref:YobI family P-loop NTPase n=1 Tax=Pantoea allii TaxID=574096 RepID=UPI003D7BCC32